MAINRVINDRWLLAIKKGVTLMVNWSNMPASLIREQLHCQHLIANIHQVHQNGYVPRHPPDTLCSSLDTSWIWGSSMASIVPSLKRKHRNTWTRHQPGTWHVEIYRYSHFRLLYIPDTSIEPLESFLNPEFQMTSQTNIYVHYNKT